MRVPWIRVHGALIDKPVVTRLAEAVKVSRHEAAGLLVTFWGAVSQHCANGQVAQYSDAQLEAWAHWSRRRGIFAKWLRDCHLDADGRVREWDEYAGKLEVIRERDRQRKSAKIPAEKNGNGHGIPAESLRNSTPARANETKRDDTKRTEDQKRGRTRAPAPSWLVEADEVWKSSVGLVTRTKLERALSPLVRAHEWPVVKAALEVYVSLDEGPAAIGRDRRVDWFAADFHRWRAIAETPLNDTDGVLTERGRRLMARPA